MKLRYAVIVFGLVCALGSPAIAGVASSASYTFDYATVGGGGNVSQSSSYKWVSRSTVRGASPRLATSAKYRLEPVTGIFDANLSTVNDWSLY